MTETKNMDIALAFGKRVKVMMALRGVTSKELAEMTGMSTQTISYIINGKTDVRLSTIHSLGEALGCSFLSVADISV